ncbi:patatin [Glaciecola nitratireducens FR1064]|uniref:Patatin n=1 Tax=Glaciecola nitratireducens (strain JCM 12485 / KCTC 12276 / FR1064) TaxID=1085623 RepID=G4QGP7_GLANF|nr:patatin [Glaciecola nitratireducens FR1064]
MLIGTSAGSQNLTSFLSRQKGYAQRLIRGLSGQKRFYQLRRGLVGGNAVDLDWYFDKTIRGKFALDFETAKKSLGERELLITTTNSGDRESYFLSPNGNTKYWRQLLKASSALPFLYRRGVKLAPRFTANSVTLAEPRADYPKDDYYLDGGLSAPLPVREAYRRGARKIIVVRTVNANFNGQSDWVHKLQAWICKSGYCPKTIDYLSQHEQAYQQELAFIADPPDDVELVQIFAKKPLHSKLLGSSDKDLQHDYNAGITAGNAFLQTHQTRHKKPPFCLI